MKSLRAVSKHFHYQRISKGHLLGNCRRGSKQFPGSCGGQTVTSLPPLAHHSPAAEQRMQQLRLLQAGTVNLAQLSPFQPDSRDCGGHCCATPLPNSPRLTSAFEIGTPEPIASFKFHFELLDSPPRSDLGHRAFKMSEFQDRRFHYELSDCRTASRGSSGTIAEP